MKRVNGFALICAMLLLSGCADMGDTRPQARVVDASTLGSGTAIERAQIDRQWPQTQWWHAYGDVQLDALVETAIAGNPDLRVAEARMREAQFRAGIAEAATKPNLEAKSSLSRQLFSEHDFIPPPEAGNYAWYNRVALEGSYDLDLWGKQRHALQAAVDEAKAASAESQIARLALENNIVRTYVQLSLQFALRDIAEDTLVHREKALQVMRKRMAAGLATESDVTQLEAAVPPLHMQIDRYDEEIALLRNQLAALSGKGPAEGERIKRPALRLENNNWLRLPSNVPADLVGRRPDVAARRWQVEASRSNIESAKAAFYPDINLMAFIGYQSIGFDTLFSSTSQVQGFGPAISLPIFEGGRLRSNLGVQSAAYDVAVENYNSTVIHALQSVSNALVIAQSEQQQKKLNDVALATASRARELASRSFAAGMTDFLVLLNSEVALLVQKQEQVQIAARLLESHAGLMVALGGGYLPEQPATSSDIPSHRMTDQP
jgi:NodT family efflux transporter outer membrane factor (OMF) lipoprotein